MTKITKRYVDSLKPEGRDYFVWDDDMPGFGVRVFASGKRYYLIQYRAGGRTRRYSIGLHGIFTPDEARRVAGDLLTDVKKGGDPSQKKTARREALTVTQLCDLYLEEGCTTKKQGTIDGDKGRIERHIKPLLGKMKVPEVTRTDIEKFLRDVADGKTSVTVKTKARGRAVVTGGKGAATRTLGLLGGIFSFAVERGIREDNPVRGVKRFKDKKCERFLSPDELKALGTALTDAENGGENPLAIAAIRALLFSGCRRTEILALKKSEVDIDHACLRLADSKTGQKVVSLGAPALQVITETMERFKNDAEYKASPYVFPGQKNDTYLVGVPKIWRGIRANAGLSDVRIHDLRHSFASVGALSGLGLVMIGSLLGHRHTATTSRYAHIGNDPLKNAADSIAKQIADSMGHTAREKPEEGKKTAEVVPMKKKQQPRIA